MNQGFFGFRKAAKAAVAANRLKEPLEEKEEDGGYPEVKGTDSAMANDLKERRGSAFPVAPQEAAAEEKGNAFSSLFKKRSGIDTIQEKEEQEETKSDLPDDPFLKCERLMKKSLTREDLEKLKDFAEKLLDAQQVEDQLRKEAEEIKSQQSGRVFEDTLAKKLSQHSKDHLYEPVMKKLTEAIETLLQDDSVRSLNDINIEMSMGAPHSP
mmetsp:Transcript_38354/g.50548  ORF Transcript_38354/g.50548 Transcript_38354/m.50548 type:complete len:211 (+) Transcript_38354:25-657(+)